MKNVLVLFLSLFLVVSCSSDDDNQNGDAQSELIGTWKLSEIYLNPGDGSGDFIPVAADDNKTITFATDGTISSNADLCFLFSESGEPSSGVFSEEDMTISVEGCFVNISPAGIEIVDSNLIISYALIEISQEKYIKID
nr:hypothetical protein [uncultured Psychroserpens sp.]